MKFNLKLAKPHPRRKSSYDNCVLNSRKTHPTNPRFSQNYIAFASETRDG